MATAAAAAAAVPDARRWSKGGPSSPVTTAIFLFFFVVVVGVLVSARWITTTVSQVLFAYCLDLSLNECFVPSTWFISYIFSLRFSNVCVGLFMHKLLIHADSSSNH
jgi:hypothetical protein